MKRLQTSDTLICFAPIPFCFSVRLQMTVGAIRILCKNSENTPVAQRISITRCPMHIFLPSGRIAALQIDPSLVYIISSFCGARRAIRIEYVVASTYLHFIISPFSLIQFPIEVQMIGLADKLSNMRDIDRDYPVCGEELWNRFRMKDKATIGWYYKGVREALREAFAETEAFTEYCSLIDKNFG